MNADELKAMLKTIDFMISDGEYELAKNMTLKAMQHLRVSSESRPEEWLNEKLKIEAELAEKYFKLKSLEDKKAAINSSLVIVTTVKTIIVCSIASLFLFLVISVVKNKVRDELSNLQNELSKIQTSLTMDEAKKLKMEAMISRNPFLYYKAALIHEKDGNIEGAIFQIEKALGLSPDNKLYKKKLKDLLMLQQEAEKKQNKQAEIQ